MRADGAGRGGRGEAGLFVGTAALVVLAAVVYGVASQEYAGTTLLLLAGAAALVMGLALVGAGRHGRAAGASAAPGTTGAGAGEGQYLPEVSVWPFGMGMGAVLMLNGLALGAWAVLPGAAIAAISTVGFARQSRHRA